MKSYSKFWDQTWVWLVFWLCMQFVAYVYYGPKILIDSTRYVEESRAWRSATFEGSYHFWYSGYIGFLCLFSDPIAQVKYIAMLQIFIAFAAFIAFMRIIDFRGSVFTKLLLAVYIIYLPYHQRNICLLTESLFCSFIIFCLFFWLNRQKRLYKYALLVSIIAVCLIRPNGFMLPTAFMLHFVWNYVDKSKRLLTILTGVLSVILILCLINEHTTVFYFFIRNSMITGDYICGYSSTYQIAQSSIIQIEREYSGTLVRLVMIFLENPCSFITLMVLKIYYLLIECRPFYNIYHNILSAATTIILYIGIAKNLRIFDRNQLWVLYFVVLNIIMVAWTYCDWDGRFFAALFPYLTYLAVKPSPLINNANTNAQKS